jgi:superfamily II RNA helicase
MDYVRIVDHDEPLPTPPEKYALSTGFEPDRFQKFAIEAIEAGDNCLVLAKTGSGKTFVGEYQIAKSLQRGGRIFYTTPIKSLSNQKFNDLKKLFHNATVGIMTGDIKFRPDAQIIVMTTEILRNLLFKKGTSTENVGTTAIMSLEGLDSVIFDEVHYINDPDRGHVWEETLILLPPAIKLILLSATLSSPIGFAKWLGESKKTKVWLISTLWRAVPLEHYVLEGSRKRLIYDSKETFYGDAYSGWLLNRGGALLAHDKFKEKVKALKASGHDGAVDGKTRPKSFEHDMNACLGSLHESEGLPAIVFVFSRNGCEKLAAKVEHTFLDSSDAAAVAHIWDFHLARYKETLDKSPQMHKLRGLAMRGIAFHHSGLMPFLKEILEILFSRGLTKVLFATETFAVGINMPTKTVIFTALDKFTDGSVRLLKSAEYIQMAGRAGRRGKDDRGTVIYLPQRDPVRVDEMRQVLCGKAATFASRMNFHYDFLLKILNASSDPTNVVTEKSLIQSSYWWALEHEEYKAAQAEVEKLSRQISEIHLTEEQASDCQTKVELELKVSQTQNAKKKAAQRELAAWHEEHRSSVWEPVLARYSKKETLRASLYQVQNTCEGMKKFLWPEDNDHNMQNTLLRHRILEECGYVSDGCLTPQGLLASEVNEGHPFMMTQLFLQQKDSLSPLSQKDLLTVLALFLGERSSDAVQRPDDLNVSKPVIDSLWAMSDVCVKMVAVEKRHGLPYDEQFWSLNLEWIEPVAEWLSAEGGSESGSAEPVILPELAAKYEIFEGNLMKALMKLAGLVEEFQAMASLTGEVQMLRMLEGARQLVLRDIVLAESLYLRI